MMVSVRPNPAASVVFLPVFRARKAFIALFTPPLVTLLNDLLVTILGGTSRVRNVVGLDVHDGGPRREVVHFLSAKLGFLDITEIPHFRSIETTA